MEKASPAGPAGLHLLPPSSFGDSDRWQVEDMNTEAMSLIKAIQANPDPDATWPDTVASCCIMLHHVASCCIMFHCCGLLDPYGIHGFMVGTPGHGWDMGHDWETSFGVRAPCCAKVSRPDFLLCGDTALFCYLARRSSFRETPAPGGPEAAPVHRWCPPVIGWCVIPMNYRYKPYKA